MENAEKKYDEAVDGAIKLLKEAGLNYMVFAIKEKCNYGRNVLNVRKIDILHLCLHMGEEEAEAFKVALSLREVAK